MEGENIFSQISLAEAAYALLENVTDQENLKNKLEAIGFSQSQAEEFVKHWRVVNHLPDTLSGFSATVFESLDHPGELSFAIRGTAGLQDLVITDASDIVLDGIALDQVVDMYNYWQRLNAGAGEYYQVARLAEASELTADLAAAYLKGEDVGDAYAALLGEQPGVIIDFPTMTVKTVVFEQSAEPDGLALIPNDLTSINVVGHSLGGHLAMAFTRLFPEINPLAYTVNGAGFRQHFNVDNLLDALAGRETVFDDNRILNLYGSAGLEFVTQDFYLGLQQQGVRIPLFTESTFKGTFGHGVGQMTDSAAVYDLFITLDNTLKTLAPMEAVSRLTPLFEAASSNKDFSLEALVNGLGDLFVPDFYPIKSMEQDNRETLFSHINEILQALFVDPNEQEPALKPEYLGLNVVDITNLDDIDLMGLAQNSIAHRYALLHLNPFVITGNGSIYDPLNPKDQNGIGPLDMESFSDQYLEDRTAMLVLDMRFAREGKNIEYLSREGSNIFRDLDSGLTLTTFADPVPGPEDPQPLIDHRFIFGTSANDDVDVFNTSYSEDHVYGGSGNDIIAGRQGRDYLEGNAGDDTLYHNDDIDPTKDDGEIDYLRGGYGNDTYFVGHGDVIEDADPGNQNALILFDGIDIRGEYVLLAGNVYRNADNGLYLTLSDTSASIRRIEADNHVTYITLQNFRDPGQVFNNGDYGISLNGQPSLPGELNLINGSDADDDLIGTELNDEIQGLTGADTISGEGGDDLLIGDIGVDDLQGGTGNDVIKAGPDNDNAAGGEGDDVIEGGDGDDFLIGGSGDDVISGDAGRDILASTTGDDFFEGGTGDDFISGGDDQDYLDGGDGNDFLAGGAGSDSLLGGAGDDVLSGDGTYVALDRNWGVTTTDTLPDDPGGLVVSFNNSISGSGISEDDQGDLLRGGDGNDILLGGGGDDQLFGEGDNDNLEGEGGDDRLEGGVGDDVLWGDSSTDINLMGMDILNGGDGHDALAGGPGSDRIDGGTGDDLLYGDQPGGSILDGDDVITGGTGNDTIYAGGGNDTVSGGRGLDKILGESGDDYIDGGKDDDLLMGNGGADNLIGGQGNDQIDGGDDNDIIAGDAGMDTLIGGAGNDKIYGGADADAIDGGVGDDEIHAGEGDDFNVQGNTGNDIIYGDEGDDVLFGQDGDDQLIGGLGADQLAGGTGQDSLSGGAGDDALFGEQDDDVLEGNDGEDTLQGGAGNDLLVGGSDNDNLFGDDGSDSLHGGPGEDYLYGNSGDDIYLFEIGDDMDIIVEQGDTSGDSLKLGVGITPADLIIEQNGNDLLLSHLLNINDQILIKDWFLGPANRLDHIDFDNGTVWNQDIIENNINYAPVANPDSVGTDEDTAVLIQAATLTLNDTDPNGDSLSISNVGNAVNGTVILDQNGNVLFTPTENFNGNATFDYTVTDGKRALADTTVTVNIASVNDAPIANPDTITLILKPTDITVPPDGEPVLIGKDEVLVNTTITGGQHEPAVASLGRGFIAVWSGQIGDVDTTGIAGQLFDEYGNKLGGEFIVNSNTNSVQERPAVTTLSDGTFAVVWSTSDPLSGDDSITGIAAQRFDAAGNKLGDEFLVNTLTMNRQWTPDISSLNNGGFVVTWVTEDPAAGSISGTGIAGQMFDSTGNKIGNEFLVNTTDAYISAAPSVAGLPDGGFVISWDTATGVDGYSDVVYQMFDSNGDKAGSEQVASTHSTLNQYAPDIGVLDNGRFVITWQTLDPAAGDADGIAGRIFEADGTPVNSEFLVNTNTNLGQSHPNVATLSDGGFVIAWTDQQIIGGFNQTDISAQRFDSDGNKVEAQFQINEFYNYNQFVPALAPLPDGGFTCLWTSTDPAIGDPSGSGTLGDAVAARIFRYEVLPATDNTITVDVLGNDTDVDDNLLTFSLDTIALQGTYGDAEIVDNKLFFDAGADYEYLDEGDVESIAIDYSMSDDDGAVSSSTAIITLIGVNDLPFVEGAITDQNIEEDSQLNFTIPRGIYHDPDADGSLVFSAVQSNGNDLPAWLSFEPDNFTFNGIPENDDVGTIIIDVTATDNFGETATTGFTLTVINVNDAPIVNASLSDQFIQANSPYNFIIPQGTFIDVDRDDTLSYSAMQENGDPLPDWLNFDPNTELFNGTPANVDNGVIDITVVAEDSSGAQVSDIFKLTVNAQPEPVTDTFETMENTPSLLTPVDLLTNDIDRDGDVLSITEMSNPVGGTIDGNIDESVSFVPSNDFNGAGGFNYTVSDDHGGISIGQAVVNVFHPVNGGDGDDLLSGTEGYDIINGGAGNDVLIGGTGDDIYLFGRGGGSDVIEESMTAVGDDLLRFKEDVAFADVMIAEDGKDLVFTIKDSGDKITLQQWKSGNSSYPFNLEFGDGLTFTTDELDMREKIAGGGNPTVRGSNFSDRLYGDDRDNHIIGKSSNDIIDGGLGNDLLEGMEGDDTYQFTAGWGQDTIIENDMTAGNVDTIAFGSGLLPSDLMFNRVGDDLIVSQIGLANTITISDWYLGEADQTEVFRTSDGSTLLNTQVEQLIQEMAAFNAESGLDWVHAVQERPEEVQVILAANWNGG